MASFVSLRFSVPQSIIKEIPPRKLAKVTVVSSRARTASKLVLSCSSNKSISMNWENSHPKQIGKCPSCKIRGASNSGWITTGDWF